ncbi:hypothetical protein DPMN_083480 [Dreissena polymorpha]|uniref:SGNH hydrolase-type esterase domain-containing protein n=1 Tax=Dreissena polymorpha TaxID=45954 RepID=A0A9D3YBB0_DREPO|nr:hypothetical protein DPMN_083480 [Dreissena polymorpha]
MPRGRGRKRTYTETVEEPAEDASRFLQPDPDIWVIGDSIPYWAGIRAIQTDKRALRTPAGKQIGWWGMRGMSWAQFRTTIESSELLNKAPDIIFINLGGNDLRNLSSTKLRNII